MRYTVMFDDVADSWAVVDTKAAGLVVAFHKQEEEAKDAAWYEEERWYKCYPLTARLSK